MNPFTLYIVLFAGAIVLFLVILAVVHPAQRACPGCDEDVAVAGRSCRHCGYVLT
jgi:predicted amidophosphoribosyltransferase